MRVIHYTLEVQYHGAEDSVVGIRKDVDEGVQRVTTGDTVLQPFVIVSLRKHFGDVVIEYVLAAAIKLS